MQLDKSAKDVVVKIVYASAGSAALAEVDALAAQAKPGTASPIVARLADAVRTFELRLPGLAVKGYSLQLKIVGVAMDQLEKSDERFAFVTDGAILVAGPGDARAAYDGFAAVLRAYDVAAPIVLVAPAPLDDVPTAPTGRAALQMLLKPLVAELAKQLEA